MRADMKLDIPLGGRILHVKAYAQARTPANPTAKLYWAGEPIETVSVAPATGEVIDRKDTERMYDTGKEVISYPQEAVDKVRDQGLVVHGVIYGTAAFVKISKPFFLVPDETDKALYVALVLYLEQSQDGALELEYTYRSARHRALIEIDHYGSLKLTEVAYEDDKTELAEPDHLFLSNCYMDPELDTAAKEITLDLPTADTGEIFERRNPMTAALQNLGG